MVWTGAAAPCKACACAASCWTSTQEAAVRHLCELPKGVLQAQQITISNAVGLQQ
jgi:hypothetical protein